MGWTISHSTAQPSYTTVSNLAAQLAHVLRGQEWRSIAYLFNRPTGDPFSVPPTEAADVARILRRAAGHGLMPADWARLTRTLADAAARAAGAGQPWAWS
ncbi:hypothetical protein ACFU99_23335 [Streptomyces sp. NPDC057654]|uniref:DUF7739 domain-containing protein n=1 Tax=Streptomyces sp. NPDC057654 TaxID=3346196 RepID=UPI00368B9E05